MPAIAFTSSIRSIVRASSRTAAAQPPASRRARLRARGDRRARGRSRVCGRRRNRIDRSVAVSARARARRHSRRHATAARRRGRPRQDHPSRPDPVGAARARLDRARVDRLPGRPSRHVGAELRERFNITATVLDQASIADRIAALPPGVSPVVGTRRGDRVDRLRQAAGGPRGDRQRAARSRDRRRSASPCARHRSRRRDVAARLARAVVRLRVGDAALGRSGRVRLPHIDGRGRRSDRDLPHDAATTSAWPSRAARMCCGVRPTDDRSRVAGRDRSATRGRSGSRAAAKIAPSA